MLLGHVLGTSQDTEGQIRNRVARGGLDCYWRALPFRTAYHRDEFAHQRVAASIALSPDFLVQQPRVVTAGLKALQQIRLEAVQLTSIRAPTPLGTRMRGIHRHAQPSTDRLARQPNTLSY